MAMPAWLPCHDQATSSGIVAALDGPGGVMPLETLLVGFVAVAAVHIVINLIGYAIGAREQPV